MIRSIIVSLFISLFSCNKKTSSPTVITPANTKTYLALGDSYTIGQSVSPSERFPMQTVSILKQQGIVLADPFYIAQTGWTTANLQNAIASQNPSPTYDIVSLLIGVNDQYQGLDTTAYAIRFTHLLEKSIQLAKGMKSNVFVLSIPDYSVTPFVSSGNKSRVRMEIDWFNTINKRITLAYGVSYTGITPSTREAETNPALLASDNLHPSGLEYKKWAEMLAPKIKAVL
ncbi:MAG: SGNH/GDSL hydrolase family protein [Flavisolibacter sp.]